MKRLRPSLDTVQRLVLIICLVQWGCTDDLPDPSEIDRLRVLAISADSPELGPGGSTTIKALVVDPEERTVTYDWYACLVTDRTTGFGSGSSAAGFSGGQGYGLDDPGDCQAQHDVGAPLARHLGTTETVTLDVPDDFLVFENVSAIYGLPPEAKEFAPLFTSIAGVNYKVQLKVTAGDAKVSAFKRINVSTAAQKNTNPTNIAFDLEAEGDEPKKRTTGDVPNDGKCFSNEVDGTITLDKGDHLLTALNAPDPPEKYQVLTGFVFGDKDDIPDTSTPPTEEQITEWLNKIAPETEETLYYSVFSTKGEFGRNIFKSTGSREVKWTLENKNDAGDVPIWIVVRDGRGGTTWCHSTIDFQP